MTISVFLRIGRQVPFVNVYIYIYLYIYLFIYIFYIYTNHILKPSQTPGALEQSFSVLVSRGQPIFSCWMWPLVTLLQSDTTFSLAANVQWFFLEMENWVLNIAIRNHASRKRDVRVGLT